jgi:predicted TIM-barrel fold metal-dependent hydrolase
MERTMIADPGTGTELRVFDIHHHVGIDEGTDGGTSLSVRLDVMDRYGIDQACLFAPSGAFGGVGATTASINDHVAAVVESASDRFPVGVAHLSLAEGEQACLTELDRAVSRLGLRGAVWHHGFQGVYLDDPIMIPLFRRCGELGVPAFVHVMDGNTLMSPWRLESLLTQAPETTVVALDGFSSNDRAGSVTGLAERFDQVLCDLGAMSAVNGRRVEGYVRRVGAERLLLGTDLYTQGTRPLTYQVPFSLLEVPQLDFSVAEKELILYGNAAKLFGL